MRLIDFLGFLSLVAVVPAAASTANISKNPAPRVGWFCPGILPEYAPKARPRFLSAADDNISMHYREKEEPFRALFVLDDSVTEASKLILRPAFEHVNNVLGRGLSARRLVDHFTQHTVCNNHQIPENQRKSSNKNDQMSAQDSYTIVIYVFVSQKSIMPGVEPCKLHEKHTVVAHALPCFEFDIFQRPTHASMIFCYQPTQFTFDEGQFREIVLHETIHAIIGLVVFAESNNPLWVKHYRGSGGGQVVTRAKVVSPNVARATRLHFRCDDIEGAELDVAVVPANILGEQAEIVPNYGHWSTRLFADELMSPLVSRRKRLSILTLALIQDTGWYRVNFSHAEPLTLSTPHPDADGCALASQTCTEYIKTQRSRSSNAMAIQPYCDRQSTRCSPDGHMSMHCNSTHEFDQCPLLLPLVHESIAFDDCHNVANKLDPELEAIGFRLGPKTICATFERLLTLTYSTKYQYPLASCVEFECLNPDVVVVRFHPRSCQSGNYEFHCAKNQAGQLVKYRPDDDCGKEALTGFIYVEKHVEFYCPDFDFVCSEHKLLQMEPIERSPLKLLPIKAADLGLGAKTLQQSPVGLIVLQILVYSFV